MATTSSTDRTKVVATIPTLNGTNYHEWADAIKAFMRVQGVWLLTKGYKTDPGLTRPTDAAQQPAWDEKNDKALGIIHLYTAPSLKHYIKDKDSALDAWDALKAAFEKPGSLGAFVAFQKLFNTVLSEGSALGPQLDAMHDAQQQVVLAGIDVSDQLLSLINPYCD